MWRCADSQIVTDVLEDLAASIICDMFLRLEKINFNIILPSTLRFENLYLPFTDSAQNCASISNFSPCYRLHILLGPLHSPGKNALSKNTEMWLRVERWLVDVLTFPEELYIQTWDVEVLRRFRKDVKKHLLVSSCLSDHPSVRPSAPTKRIFTKFDIWVLFENLHRKFKFR